jgi:hypothetical protein
VQAIPPGRQPDFGIASISQFQFSLDPVPVPEPALWPVVLTRSFSEVRSNAKRGRAFVREPLFRAL